MQWLVYLEETPNFGKDTSFASRSRMANYPASEIAVTHYTEFTLGKKPQFSLGKLSRTTRDVEFLSNSDCPIHIVHSQFNCNFANMSGSVWYVKEKIPTPFRVVPESRPPRESGRLEMLALISLVDDVKRSDIGQTNTWRADWNEASFKLGIGVGYLIDTAANFLKGLDDKDKNWDDQRELFMFVLGLFSAFRAQQGEKEPDCRPLQLLSRGWLLHKANDSER